MSKPATTAFNGGPNDKLKTVDVYGEPTAATQNNNEPEDSAFNQALTKAYTKTKEYGSDVKQRAGETAMTPASARSNIKGALGGSKGSVDNLGTEISRVMFGDIQEGSSMDVPGAERNYYKVFELSRKNTEGDVDSYLVKGQEPMTVKSVMAMAQDVTGSKSFTGSALDSEAAILHGVLIQLDEWGVPELLEDVLEDIKNKALLAEVARRSAMRLAQSGNIDAIESLLKKIGAEAMVAQNPMMAETLLNMYRFPIKQTPADYPARLIQLVWVMDQLKPGWLWTYRGLELVWDLSVLTRISDDAKKVFSTDEAYRTPVAIAGLYRRQTAHSLLSKMYPLMPLVL